MTAITFDELSEIDEFLRAWPHVTLATCDERGQPEAAVIGVAITAQGELIFDTLESTRKYPNLVANPRVAVTIGWDDHRTIQLEGLAERFAPDAPDNAPLLALYLERFPDGQQRRSWPGIAYFRVQPTWLRYADYRAEPRIIELDEPSLGLMLATLRP